MIADYPYVLLYNLDDPRVPLAVALVLAETEDRFYLDTGGIDPARYRSVQHDVRNGERLSFIDKSRPHVLILDPTDVPGLDAAYRQSQEEMARAYRRAPLSIVHPGRQFRQATMQWKAERDAAIAAWLDHLRELDYYVGGPA